MIKFLTVLAYFSPSWTSLVGLSFASFDIGSGITDTAWVGCEVTHSLQDFQPIKFDRKNRILYLTGLSL